MSAATLEVAESALTGESVPVSKGIDAVSGGRRPPRRPDRHGLHEHEHDPRHGPVRRHRHGDGDRGRPHLEPPPVGGRDGDAAHAPAREADEPDPVHRGRRRRAFDDPQPLPRRNLQDRLHGRDRVRGLGDPDRSAGGRDDDPLARDADPRARRSAKETSRERWRRRPRPRLSGARRRRRRAAPPESLRQSECRRVRRAECGASRLRTTGSSSRGRRAVLRPRRPRRQ